MSATTVKLMS
nr:unnamed protein product [Callosobruchus analis]